MTNGMKRQELSPRPGEGTTVMTAKKSDLPSSSVTLMWRISLDLHQAVRHDALSRPQLISGRPTPELP